MGVNIKNTSAGDEKAGELGRASHQPGKGDALLSTIHRGCSRLEEYLYPAMGDYRLDIIIDQARRARVSVSICQSSTLVGATTRAGMVSAPLRSRSE